MVGMPLRRKTGTVAESLHRLPTVRVRQIRDEAMTACGPWAEDVGPIAERELEERQAKHHVG